MSIEEKLKNLNIVLPAAPQALANYTAYQLIDQTVIISGQLPFKEGKICFSGKVGQTLTLEEGQAAARQCAINIITHLKAACEGNLERVKRCVRLGGFINCDPDYKDHAKVMNGASDLMVAIFGEAGRHTRIAVGVNSLPLGAAVEIEATFIIHDFAC